MKLLASVRDLLNGIRELLKHAADDSRSARRASEDTLAAITVLLAKPKPKRSGQVLLLWTAHPSEDPAGPCCAVVSFELEDGCFRDVEIQAHAAVPPGAWLVGLGCVIGQTLVGNEIQNLGRLPSAYGVASHYVSLLRLRDPLMHGMLLRTTVRCP